MRRECSDWFYVPSHGEIVTEIFTSWTGRKTSRNIPVASSRIVVNPPFSPYWHVPSYSRRVRPAEVLTVLGLLRGGEVQTSAAWRGLEWYLLAGACACLMPPWTLLARGRVIPDCVLTTRSAPRISWLCGFSQCRRSRLAVRLGICLFAPLAHSPSSRGDLILHIRRIV